MNQFWQLNYNKVVQIFTSSLEIIVQLSEIKYEKGRFYKEDLTFQHMYLVLTTCCNAMQCSIVQCSI